MEINNEPPICTLSYVIRHVSAVECPNRLSLNRAQADRRLGMLVPAVQAD